MPVAITAALLLALAPLMRAQQSPAAAAQPPAAVSPSDPNAPLESLPKAERLKLVADLLQQLSDLEYAKMKPADGKPFRASRAEAISAVYGTLAALQYKQALKAGPDAEAKPQVEAALQTKLRDADALAVNPDTLEDAGFLSHLWQGLREPAVQADYSRWRQNYPMAVLGGRSIVTEAEKKAVKLKKAVQEAEARLAKPDLPAAEKAALHYETGRLYDELAACGLGAASAPSAADQEARLRQVADLLQQLSDEEYLKTAPAGGKPFRASRAEAIGAVYGTLAALEYRKAIDAGPTAEEKPRVEAALQTKLKDADALAVNPDTLENAGWWSSFSDYINRDPALRVRYGTAVAAVRGGRSIDTEAERKAVKLKKAIQEAAARLAKSDLAATEKAALHFEQGKLYDELAVCGLGKAAAETDFSALETKLNELADLLQRISDEDYLRVAAEQSTSQAGSFRLIRPTRAEAIKASYGALATLAFYQALKASPDEKERPDYQTDLAASARIELGADPAGIEETGYWSNLWTGLNQGSSEGYSGYRGAAVAAVRGGRTVDTEAERTAVKLKRELQEASRNFVRGHPCVGHRRRGRIYRRLAECGLGMTPAPETPRPVVEAPQAPPPAPEPPKAPAAQAEPAQAEPVVDEVKAGTAELDKMGKEMQGEIDKRRR